MGINKERIHKGIPKIEKSAGPTINVSIITSLFLIKKY